jgi:hypothetical protein
MELELKHLAPYFPYNLKFIDKVANRQFDALSWIINGASQPHNSGFKNNLDQLLRDQELRVLLHSLSDLTKEIEVNGSLIYPCRFFGLEPNEKHQIFLTTKIVEKWMSYKEMEVLFKHHFDVFGLIDEGLALPLI